VLLGGAHDSFAVQVRSTCQRMVHWVRRRPVVTSGPARIVANEGHVRGPEHVVVDADHELVVTTG
jgi:hypothetical protein